jgi:hypothetical protein
MRKLALAACLPLLAVTLAAGCSKSAGGHGVASANGSARPSATSTGSFADQARRHAQCMREHGVPEADPVVGPNGEVHAGGGYDKQQLDGDLLKTAIAACKPYEPVLTGPDAEAKRRGGLVLAQCMRAHGVENFPDPDANGRLNTDIPGLQDDPDYQDAWTYCRSQPDSPAPTVTK